MTQKGEAGRAPEARPVVDEGVEAARATSWSTSLLLASGLGSSTEEPLPCTLDSRHYLGRAVI